MLEYEEPLKWLLKIQILSVSVKFTRDTFEEQKLLRYNQIMKLYDSNDNVEK